MNKRSIAKALLLAAGLAAGAAHAALPALTPAQQQAAAAKKVKDDAQAAKDKQELADSMDAVAAHYRTRAAAMGWKTHAPVAIAAAAPVPSAAAAPAAAAPGAAGAAGIATAASANGPAGQPSGQLTQAGANPPIRSEKLGTAPPSTDVKAHPTPSLPAGTPPAVVKDTPKVKNK